MERKKSFFRERTAEEIQELNLIKIYSPKGLVERIGTTGGLDPTQDALEIRTQITPARFYRGGLRGAEASRKCYKHGDLIRLTQPSTQAEAYTCKDIPLAVRTRDFSALEGMKEEEINFVGYSFVPVQGRDRTRRVVPFVWLLEAERLFAYAENNTFYEDSEGNVKPGIEIDARYVDSAKVKKEGASIICHVPSRSAKKPRYVIKLLHVPVDGTTEKRAVIWSLKPSLVVDEQGEPLSERVTHDSYRLKYNWESARKESEDIVFYPHDIASYIKIVGDFWKKHNLTPLEMNPFALFSKQGAEFYKKLCNNVIIFDPTLKSKAKLRKLHLDEESILLARAIGRFGHDDFAYWDFERDGKLKDYDWSISSH